MNVEKKPTYMKILSYIRKYVVKNGRAPSMREIGRAVRLKSPSSVQYALFQLEKKGYIVREPNTSRSIRIVDMFPDLEEKSKYVAREMAAILEYYQMNLSSPDEVYLVDIATKTFTPIKEYMEDCIEVYNPTK